MDAGAFGVAVPYVAWVEEQTGAELSDLFDGWLLAKRSPTFE